MNPSPGSSSCLCGVGADVCSKKLGWDITKRKSQFSVFKSSQSFCDNVMVCYLLGLLTSTSSRSDWIISHDFYKSRHRLLRLAQEDT
jgi:hypothetical protein